MCALLATLNALEHIEQCNLPLHISRFCKNSYDICVWLTIFNRQHRQTESNNESRKYDVLATNRCDEHVELALIKVNLFSPNVQNVAWSSLSSAATLHNIYNIWYIYIYLHCLQYTRIKIKQSWITSKMPTYAIWSRIYKTLVESSTFRGATKQHELAELVTFREWSVLTEAQSSRD